MKNEYFVYDIEDEEFETFETEKDAIKKCAEWAEEWATNSTLPRSYRELAVRSVIYGKILGCGNIFVNVNIAHIVD